MHPPSLLPEPCSNTVRDTGFCGHPDRGIFVEQQDFGVFRPCVCGGHSRNSLPTRTKDCAVREVDYSLLLMLDTCFNFIPAWLIPE